MKGKGREKRAARLRRDAEAQASWSAAYWTRSQMPDRSRAWRDGQRALARGAEEKAKMLAAEATALDGQKINLGLWGPEARSATAARD